MKFSEQWLREWVNPEVTTDELIAQLTMAGLEVESVESVAGQFHGVVVAEIVAVEQHPDADKLRVCSVLTNVGGETLQVVCGAPNAAVGLKIPFAQVGAELPGDLKIKKAKLRGVESFGMLCGASELGLEESSAGLLTLPQDAPIGTDIRDYLHLNDKIIEVDLTPNRGDCLGIAGIAREVGVINKCDVTAIKISAVEAVHAEQLEIKLTAQECSHYVGRIIKNISNNATTPLWMQEKLRRSDIRCIDPVVDVTNYVLMELGQPMHAFDLAKLEGGIEVRFAQQGEQLLMLNGQSAELSTNTLVIADAKKAVAMAGIMGGEPTSVTAETCNIFLESAYFDPIAIAGKARAYGLHTDSSHRFERGVDYQLQAVAIERATQLLLEIVGGEPGPLCEATNETALPQAPVVELKYARVKKALGLDIPPTEISEMFTRLGFGLEQFEDGLRVKIPSYRFDISIAADLYEEIARIYGYNRLPSCSIHTNLALKKKPEAQVGTQAIRQQLIARGYQEAICYSFIDQEISEMFSPGAEVIKLTNPISADMSVMRTTLLPGLFIALQHNLNRQQKRVRLFETGLSFVLGPNGLQQEAMIAGLICGSRMPESWFAKEESVDFYDLKGDLESILALTKDVQSFTFSAGTRDAAHPGQCANILREGKIIGFIGALHPNLQQRLSINNAVFMFEIQLSALIDANLPAFKSLSKYPEVRRDIAVVVEQTLIADELLAVVNQEAGESLVDLIIFDVYQGKGIESNRKSLALGLTYQHPSRTLNEDEINESVARVVSALKSKFGAILRE